MILLKSARKMRNLVPYKKCEEIGRLLVGLEGFLKG